MTRLTPTVRNKALDAGPGKRLKLSNRSDWLAWLEAEETAVFRYEGDEGSFTARKERRARGGYYWTAYRKYMNRLHKVYMGRSEVLTPDVLAATAVALQDRITASHQPTAQAQAE